MERGLKVKRLFTKKSEEGRPLVSIVTPVYNGEKYVEETIQSIVNQTYDNIEHIVIDGGSTDGTLDILRKYECTYNMIWLSESDNGMYDAINKGFNLSKGEIMAWINADDMYLPWSIEIVVNAITKLNIDWCTGVPGQWSKQGLHHNLPFFIPIYSRTLIKRGCYHGKGLGFIQQESTFWTRRLWNKAGGKVNSTLELAGDFYLWKSFAEHSQLYTINAVLAGRRVHKDQKTFSGMEKYYNELRNNCNIFTTGLRICNKLFKINLVISMLNRRYLVKTVDLIAGD
ncbi:glycosyltransferase [Dehalococcoidia bacterium]|nr:glycosyltransferase [Dehalococcoidia bacterium]